MSPLPTEVEVAIAGTTLTLALQYGTAVREEDGEVWDHDALWYPGDSGTPDEAWDRAQAQFVQDPDEPPQELVLVWRITTDADDWIEWPVTNHTDGSTS